MARFVIPEGWVTQAYRFALDPTPAQERAMLSHTGAARFAFNHMLTMVKAVMNQRAAERSYGIPEDDLTPALGWSSPSLLKVWNVVKHDAAPWWEENSKESYKFGIDSLAQALDYWNKSRSGKRAGKPVGFPRFKSKSERPSVRFTTGPLRVEPDRHHITLPKLRTIRTHESTRKLARRIEAGTARILSATLTRDGTGRWNIAFNVLVQRAVGSNAPRETTSGHKRVVGVDVGVKDLLVVATPDGHEITRVGARMPLLESRARLRFLQRRASRQRGPWDPKTNSRQTPSKRWSRTQYQIAKSNAHASNIRRDALHKATTALAHTHDVIVVETLNAAGLRTGRSARKRGLNRALADAAIGTVRAMLVYKTRWYGSTLVEADRFYPSSKTCSSCGSRKPRLTLAERVFECDTCGTRIDRDLNAAINLARLGENRVSNQSPAGSGPEEGRGAIRKPRPAQAGKAGGCEASTPHRHRLDKTGTASPQGEAA